MKQQIASRVKVGNCLSKTVVDVSVPGCRTAAQHNAVLDWHRSHPSAFWAGNPFQQEVPGDVFRCSFYHSYFTPDGRLAGVWVTPTGRVKPIVRNSAPHFELECRAVVARYGVFSGKAGA